MIDFDNISGKLSTTSGRRNVISRLLRTEHNIAVYHITARGNERKNIFLDNNL